MFLSFICESPLEGRIAVAWPDHSCNQSVLILFDLQYKIKPVPVNTHPEVFFGIDLLPTGIEKVPAASLEERLQFLIDIRHFLSGQQGLKIDSAEFILFRRLQAGFSHAEQG